MKYQVHKWDKGKIAAGQYQFPFSFNFPEDLPNSYEFYGDVKKGEPNAKIEYTVVCELDFEDKTFRKKEKINICRPKQVHQEEGKSRIFEFNVKQFFCCNKGTATVNPKFSSNNYRPGETADIITEVDNKDGKFYIEKIICDLKSEVTVGGNPPIKKFCKQAYYIGVNPNEDRTGEKKIKFTMEIPKDLQSATAGSLIQNKYELWCHCEQNTCCTNTALRDDTDFKTNVPVDIYKEHCAYVPEFEQDEFDWNPYTTPVYIAQFNNEYRYEGRCEGGPHVDPGMVDPKDINL